MNRHALVTGAASGIGLDCCRDLVEQGVTVHAVDRDGDALAQARHTHGEHYVSHVGDVSRTDDWRRIVEAIRARTPTLDALVISAGVFCAGPVLETDEDAFDRTFAINTKCAWLAARHALPLLEAAASPDHPARIVFVASIAAIRPKVDGGVYAATKVAMVQLMRVMAVELAGRSILVNAVAPATVDTPFIASGHGAGTGYVASGRSPLGRIAQPADVSAVVRFLLSDAARYLAGVVLPIDGGTTAAFVPR